MFNNKLKIQLTQLQSTISTQQATIDRLTTELALKKQNLADKESQLSKFSTEQWTELELQIKLKQNELLSISEQLESAQNSIQLQSLSFFNLEFNSQHYKDELKDNRLKQKELLLNDNNYHLSEKWFINGNEKSGRALCKFLINICINSFNQLSDSCMKSVNVANYQSLYNKLTRAYKNYNDNLNKFNIVLNSAYLELKLEELKLNRNIDIKLVEEKEELAREKEILREQLRVDKELEREREKLCVALVKLRAEQDNGSDVQSQIDEIEDKLGDNDKLLKNGRAGFVYIISNASLGMNIWKIGVTRQPDWNTRLDQLNNASVPFLFKPNCILFSDDAFALESSLHQEFSQYRVNKINMRKEYFKLPLSQIERVIKEKYDPHAIFNYDICDPNFLASGYKLIDNFVDNGVEV